MPIIFIYLLKLSVSLAAVYFFYQLILRRLTFYNWNRWYFLGYSVLSFFITFFNISSVLERNEWGNSNVIQWVPAIVSGTTVVPSSPVTIAAHNLFSGWEIAFIIFLTGVVVMLFRLAIQLLSFRNMEKRAKLLHTDGLNLYQVTEKIIPFSFGNSIFINPDLHSRSELEEIILHEFVHVKQKHSVDIIWAEILCLLNWYNPCAWLLRRAIRQNLEFIADNKVLENGINPKQYQYLLLKVIGNNHFSIASKFNFSSLKKRIAMMNKIKTARVHALRFLFVLPVVCFMLLAFRSKNKSNSKPHIRYASLVIDHQTRNPLSGVKVVNSNTGQEAITDSKGFYTMELPADKPLHVHMNYSKEGYIDLATNSFSLEKKDNSQSISLVEVVEMGKGAANQVCKECGTSISVRNENNPSIGYSEVKEYEKWLKSFLKDTVPSAPKTVNGKNLSAVSDDYEITDNRAVIHLKNGKTEEYDLKNKEQREKFEKKYGKIVSANVHNGPMTTVSVVTADGVKTSIAPINVVTATGSNTITSSVSTNVDVATTVNGEPIKAVTNARTVNVEPIKAISNATTVIAPMHPTSADNVQVFNGDEPVLEGKEEILITITKNATREQLDEYKKQMKEKNIELNFDEIEYDNNGTLIRLSGTMKSKDGTSNFVASSFSKLTLSVVRNGEHSYFKVRTTNNKVSL